MSALVVVSDTYANGTGVVEVGLMDLPACDRSVRTIEAVDAILGHVAAAAGGPPIDRQPRRWRLWCRAEDSIRYRTSILIALREIALP